MTAEVRIVPPLPSRADVVVGRPVRGPTWRRMGELHNWLLGRGATLVAGYNPASTVPASSSRSFRFYVAPRVQARSRFWVLGLRKDPGGQFGSDGVVEVTVEGQARGSITVSNDLTTNLYRVIDPIVTPSATPAPIELILTNTDASFEVTVDWIACYEVPAFELATNATEHGVELGSLQTQAPIYAATGQGPGGLALAAKQVRTTARRAGLFCWAVDLDDTSARAVSTSATPSPLFLLDPVIQARRITDASLPTVTVAALMQASDSGTDARVAVASTLAADTLNLDRIGASSTAWGWVVGTIEVKPEALDNADGGPNGAGTHETLSFELSRTKGTGQARCAAVCVVEVP